MKSNAAKYTQFIKEQASALGFLGVTVARAEKMEPEARRLEKWLFQGYQGEMKYLENHFEKRIDPRMLVPGAKSVISLAYNYYPEEDHLTEHPPKIARYAYGKDYHKIVKKKLKMLYRSMEETIGNISGRYFVDSAPVLERDWARRSGLGWIGKNTLLIHPKKGSYFFLAEIISDVELLYDSPMRDHCGTCRRCIEACPTEAFSPEGYLMDASRCISYLTIELKSEIPGEFSGKMADYIFGCDICQEVCPWNRFSNSHQEEAFKPDKALLSMTKDDWEALTEDTFNQLFAGSAVKRSKYSGIKRNIDFLYNKT